MRFFLSSRWRVGLALVGASAVSVCLFLATVVVNHSWLYFYLIQNLLLAWIPLGLAVWLVRLLKTKLWSCWLPLAVTLAWLGFLPNTFYVITDFIHLYEVPRVDLLLDVIMLTSFVVNAFTLGCLSLYLVHLELAKRFRGLGTTLILGVVMLAVSFAIYMGRELRWNTWDIITNPTSVLFDVTDRLLNLGSNPLLVSITLGFFVLIATLYTLVWQLARASQPRR